jgi:Protein of unknown function (DUF3311)
MSSSAARPPRFARLFVYAMFLIVAVGALWVPFYNRVEPTVYGIPFFYWFQVAWILVTAAATAIAYRLRL